jgi:hypothetical protein
MLASTRSILAHDKEIAMNRKLLASALGVLMLAGSGMALADGRPGGIERSFNQVHGDRGWRPDQRGGDRQRGGGDWGRGHRDSRGHGPHYGYRHYHGHGHYKRYWHQRPHHGGWRPHGYDRDGVTIIFRGSFY